MNILVVYKHSTLSFYEHSDDDRVRRLIASDHRLAVEKRQDREANIRSIESVLRTLDRSGANVDTAYRASVGCTTGKDLVIAVGGDGTFLDAAHHTGDSVPILGVNSNPVTSEGALLPYRAQTLQAALDELDAQPRHTVYRRHLVIDGVITGPPVLNDIQYCDESPAGTTDCYVRFDDRAFRHRNYSGILLSTATGSSAFIWNEGATPLPFEDRRIILHERSKRNAGHLVGESVEIESWSREGHVYLDGKHLVYPAGLLANVRFEPGAPTLTIIGDIKAERAAYIARHLKASLR